MPEIKNNFLRGRMNKDHDERLVGKGEYRDAMNVQVSSSDGSNVGSVQNILGNRSIGNDFWNSELGKHWSCVGSIASEKDNKFYYFITHKPIPHAGFNSQSSGWTYSNKIATYGGTVYAWVDIDLSGFVSIGDTYEISFTNTTTSGNPIQVQLGGVFSEPITTTGQQVVYITAGDDYTLGNTANSVRFYAGDDDFPNNRWNGTISDVVITKQASYIIEYDTSKDTPGQNPNNLLGYNSVTPVFTDPGNEVLKLNHDRPITAINIIDGLLFWTDNYSEPKKINIQRCIDGTALDGQSATTFISNQLAVVVVEESHISVIKKSPKKAPLLRKENFRHKDKQYSADMRISSGDKYDNDLINSSKGVIHDFSSLSVGDTFRTKLISHKDSGNEVVLEWEAGDEVVLKEYPTHGFNNVEYRIKATLTNWSGNVFKTTNYMINSNQDLESGSQGVASKWSGTGFLGFDVIGSGGTNLIPQFNNNNK